MRSGTSFFNGTLYRKNLTRFWPLWAMYGVIWLYMLPLNLLNAFLQNSWSNAADRSVYLAQECQDIPLLLSGMGVPMAIFFGLLAAMAVFSYLYNSRSACAMHALPLRREALFTTSYLSGLSFLVLPNAVVALLTALIQVCVIRGDGLGIALSALGVWFLVQSALCLFFYSFTVFCAMFTGHILALPVFYGILNFLAGGLYFLVGGLCEEFLYGFIGFEGPFDSLITYLTPSISLYQAVQWETVWIDGQPTGAAALQSPLTVAGYAVAALVLVLLALEVYKFRHVESAGDVVSVGLVKPLFRYGVSFCSGLAFGTWTALFFGMSGEALPFSVFIVLWAVIGCFVAEMFLRKSFRVLRVWKGAAVMAVVMALMCGACAMDWFGYETRVPDPGDVESVFVVLPSTAPYDSAYGGGADLTGPDRIAAAVALHRAIVDEGEEGDGGWDDINAVTFTYTLKNGTTLSRRYTIRLREADLNQEGTVTQAADRLVNDRELVAKNYDFDLYKERGHLADAYLSNWLDPATGERSYEYRYLDDIPTSELTGLWEAVLADFDEGNIGRRYLLTNSTARYANTYVTDLTLDWNVASPDTGEAADTHPTATRPANYTNSLSITLTPQAAHTIGWLEDHGVLGESCQLLPHSLEETQERTASAVIPQTY